MKILNFNLNEILLTNNQIQFSDTFRMALFQRDKVIFDLLDYDNDSAFLEPSLIGFFLSDVDVMNKIPLEQILFGYILEKKQSDEITLKTDTFGAVNLPNLGYLKAKPNEIFKINKSEVKNKLIPNQFILNSGIRLCLHSTYHLEYSKGIIFDEPVEITLKKNQDSLNQAVSFFQSHLSDLWSLISSITREFVIFSSPNHNSFAGINHQGTAYFNTENRMVSPIFFIEDIAHQCGHIVFNILTLQTSDFLKVSKDFSLKEFSDNPFEERGVYGAFHGLFTYTTIATSLSKVIDMGITLEESLVLEAKARLGFFVEKFSKDLKLMKNRAILTEEGMSYHCMFESGYQFIKDNYEDIYKNFNYNNQPYNFDFEVFKKENNIQLT